MKKWLIIGSFSALSLFNSITNIQAAIEVNIADESALQTIKGIGPTRAKAIIHERNQNGPYHNAEDLAERIRGLSQTSVAHLEAQGLTFSKTNAPVSPQKNGLAKPPSQSK